MFGDRVRRLRQEAGLSQAALAARAGVSRQLVGAVEAGRHLPRIDAGAALATVLGVPVESLLAPPAGAATDAHGEPPSPGQPVRVGRVGDRLVCRPCQPGDSGWEPADGSTSAAGVELLPGARPGGVVVGCDPSLGLAEQLVARSAGPALMTVSASTTAAIAALRAGRAHAAAVHGPPGRLPAAPAGVRRWQLAAWRVGLATAAPTPGWEEAAIAGASPVVQREAGAQVQRAFERAVDGAGGTAPTGPRVGGHLAAAAAARARGLPAVTIEPAALAAGLAFHPLEEHTCELWVDDRWRSEHAIVALLDVVGSAAFASRLAAVGGYDLAGAGAAA